MSENTETSIINYIANTAESFLRDDMNLEVLNTGEVIECNIDERYLGTVMFTKNDINILCIVSMDKPLFERIFKIFFPEELDSDEYEELKNDLPNEIVNTIAGLSISKFDDKHKDFEMSVPISFKNSAISKLKEKKDFKSLEIITSEGSLICAVV